jgi:hypothetical protein
MKALSPTLSRSAVAAALAFFVSTGTVASAAPAGHAARGDSAAGRRMAQAATPASFQPAGTSSTAGASVPSAEDEAAGKRHYRRGDELFKQGRFLEAAHEFEAGFAVAPRPLFLLNIGHSYRKAQELRRARAAYEDFLKADPGTSFRNDVEDLIKTIDDALGASALPAPVPTTPSPAVVPAPTSPAAGPVSAPAASPGLPSGIGLPPAASPSIPVRTGTIDLAPPVLIEVEKPAGPTAESDSLFRSPWFWGAVGLVIAAGVAGTVYGLNRTPACNATRCLRETD